MRKRVIPLEVTFQDITLAYPHQAPTLAHFTWTVPDGKLTALLGPSGSGKTTLLNLLAGLLTPDHGRLLFDQVDVTHQGMGQRNVGMVFQDYALYPHLTVHDNIAFPLKMAHVKRAEREAQTRQFAALVRVTPFLQKYPRELSGGQQQRVALARALIQRPAVLLLDEPLSNLDAELRVTLRQEIRRIQQATGVTTIFVTHNQADALQIADTITLLHHGQIQQTGTGHQLYHTPANLTVARFVGSPRLTTLPFTALAASLPDSLAARFASSATLVGIRSEALLATPTPIPLLTTQTMRLTAQDFLGRDIVSHLRWHQHDLISTALPPLAPGEYPIGLAAPGCYFFAANGRCLWTGGTDHAEF